MPPGGGQASSDQQPMSTSRKAPAKAAGDISKAQLFKALGYDDDPARLEALLEQARLSRPNKVNIAASKREAVQAIIGRHFYLVCGRGDCWAAAQERVNAGEETRQIARAASQPHCEICGGSTNQRFVEDMVAAFAARGWQRLCVVGGSPNAREELERLVAGRLELRLVDGTRARTDKEARADLAWSHCVVLWGSTQLDHKVSEHYAGPKVITVYRRGIAELAKAVVAAARGE